MSDNETRALGRDELRMALAAAERVDWQQVVLNGGPPCFHVDNGKFCLRAQRWFGHDDLHTYVSLAFLLQALAAPESKP